MLDTIWCDFSSSVMSRKQIRFLVSRLIRPQVNNSCASSCGLLMACTSGSKCFHTVCNSGLAAIWIRSYRKTQPCKKYVFITLPSDVYRVWLIQNNSSHWALNHSCTHVVSAKATPKLMKRPSWSKGLHSLCVHSCTFMLHKNCSESVYEAQQKWVFHSTSYRLTTHRFLNGYGWNQRGELNLTIVAQQAALETNHCCHDSHF